MMRHNSSGFIALAGISALANAAYATQPPCATSDVQGNTACGSAALHLNTGVYNSAIGDGALKSNTTGNFNTASGFYALADNTTGNKNTASGYSALSSNTTGAYNTANGFDALAENISGAYNTASGHEALFLNTTGTANTASGYEALVNNTTGIDNTANGAYALFYNNTGNDNIATGFGVLNYNLDGYSNTASGWEAMYFNTHGYDNTATGYGALYLNETGHHNTAYGVDALYSTNGINSTAVGAGTLFNNTTGNSNIAVGYQAGYYPTGSNNIDIGNAGAAADNGFIRIGTAGTHKGSFIAGISSSKVTGSAVFVTTGGRLGVLASSERYKTAIASIGSDTAKLQDLRPVKFHLKADPYGAVQYGLIAEEVAKVYPELVIHDEKGRIDGVRYDELAPMLLNELQKAQATIGTQDQRLASLEQQLADIQAALVRMQPNDGLLAQR